MPSLDFPVHHNGVKPHSNYGLLVLWGVFVAVARIFNLVIAGVQPEAWVLTAMMTAPFTTGEMSRRIEGDDRVHIEYVPTQVVTEFIRAKVIWGESKVDGIRYASSVKRGTRRTCFLLISRTWSGRRRPVCR